MKSLRRSILMAGLGLCALDAVLAADLVPPPNLNLVQERHVQFIGLANLLKNPMMPLSRKKRESGNQTCGGLWEREFQSVEKHEDKKDVMEQLLPASEPHLELQDFGKQESTSSVCSQSASNPEEELQEAKDYIQELEERIQVMEQSKCKISKSNRSVANQAFYRQLEELESTLELYRRFSPENVIELAGRSAKSIFMDIYSDIPYSPTKNELISRSSEIFQQNYLYYLRYCEEVGNDAALVSDFCQSYGINVVNDLLELFDSIRKGSTILKFQGKLKDKVRSCRIPEKFEEYCRNNVMQRDCEYESPYKKIKELENEVDQLKHEIRGLQQKLKKDNDLADQRERQSKESYEALQRKYEEAKRINDTAKEAIKKSEDLKRQLENLWRDHKGLDLKLALIHWQSFGKASYHPQQQIGALIYFEIPERISNNFAENNDSVEALQRENVAFRTRVEGLENEIKNHKKSSELLLSKGVVDN